MVGIALLAEAFWLLSAHGAIWRWEISSTSSADISRGVIEIRHIYALDIASPVPVNAWQTVQTKNAWLPPPFQKGWPWLTYSSGHVTGMQDADPYLSLIHPANYWLLRIPLWFLMIPCVLWLPFRIQRWHRYIVHPGGGRGFEPAAGCNDAASSSSMASTSIPPSCQR
jgi:hypothetical protein